MRLLAIAIAVLAALWSGYWVFGAEAVERGALAWLERLRSEGWEAGAEVSVAGFPNRFDLTLEDISLVDPDSGLAWEAPRFQVLALSYRRNHAILVWPGEQVVRTPRGALTVAADGMRGSIRSRGGFDRELESLRIVAEGVAVDLPSGSRVGVPSALFAVERRPESGAAYRVGFSVEDAFLRRDPGSAVDAGAGPADRGGRVDLDATVAFDSPLKVSSAEDRLPRPTRIGIDGARLLWGDLDLSASGALDIAPDGTPDGRITLKMEDWRGALTLGVDAGYIPRDSAPMLEGLLGALAGADPEGGNALEAPLVFQRGGLWLGVIPLGRAPSLVIR